MLTSTALLEKRGELVKLPLRDRIVFVIVTASALEREGEPVARPYQRSRRGRLVLCRELLDMDSTFAAGQGIAMKSGGDLVLHRRPRRDGSRPAVPSNVKQSNGMLSLKAPTTQSRYLQACSRT